MLRGPNTWLQLKVPDTRDNTMLAEASGPLQTKGFQEVEYNIALKPVHQSFLSSTRNIMITHSLRVNLLHICRFPHTSLNYSAFLSLSLSLSLSLPPPTRGDGVVILSSRNSLLISSFVTFCQVVVGAAKFEEDALNPLGHSGLYARR